MHLKSIEASGVKVPHFKHDLKPISLIVGENASHKTSILTAARIALTGKNPLQKKAPIKVTAVCGNGTDRLVREWKLVKGAPKAAHDLPDGWPETPVVLLDPLDYLDKSDTERVKYVARLVGSDDMDGGWVVDKVRAITFDAPTREIILAHEAECDELSESDHARHEAGQSVQDWLTALCADKGVMYNKWVAAKASVERLKGFGAAQVQLQVGEAQATRNVDGELDVASQRVGELRAAAESYAGKINRQLELATQRRRLTDAIAVLEGNGQVDKAEIERQIAEIEARLAKSQVETLANESARLNNAVQLAQAGELAQKQMADKLQKELAAESKRECLCCGNTGEACTATKKRMAVISKSLAKAQAEHKRLNAEANEQNVKLLAAVKARDAAKSAEREDSAKVFELRMTLGKANTAALELSTKRGMLAALEKDDTDYTPLIQQSNSALTAAQERVRELTAMQKRHAAAQQEEARRQQSLTELTKAEASFAVVKAVREKVLECQAEAVAKSFGTILKTINRVASGLIETAIEYADGEVGRRAKSGEWISHRDMSGFEKCVCYCGIAAALAQSAPVKLVLVDDLIISRQNKHRLVTRAMELIKAGTIDQLLITDCHAEDYAEFRNHHSDIFGVVEV